MAITPFSYDMDIITKLSDTPNVDDGLTAFQLKEKFDEGGKAIKRYINDVLLSELPDKPKTDGVLKAVDGELVAAVDGVDYQAPIKDGELSTRKLADGAVTRAKLATNALYNPIKIITGVSEYEITAADIGSTLRSGWNEKITFRVKSSASIPVGTVIAILTYGNADNILTISFDDVRLARKGRGVYPLGTSIVIPDNFDTIALEKILNDSSGAQGDMWLVTGDVEVVS